jgi:hypoxanthine phosphoribosyltransferase
MQDYKEFLEEVLIPEEALNKRIAQLGEQISQDYAGRDLLLVCILRGGVIFLSDLMRHITNPLTLDFMAVSSYGIGARASTGQARITLDLNTDICGRNVLVIEDIVDSGYTIQAVLNLLETRRPATLRVCTLLDKASRRAIPVPIDYCGFIIPDKFIFGFGLDVDEYYRNLPFIGTLDQKRYKPLV